MIGRLAGWLALTVVYAAFLASLTLLTLRASAGVEQHPPPCHWITNITCAGPIHPLLGE